MVMTTVHTPSDEAYRQAGVDLQRADSAVTIAKAAAQRTTSRALTGAIGQFAGAFELPTGYSQPVLLTACDGVGTKLKLAVEAGIHHTVGIDLVAMSVNDILANGGEPLVFLDYFATGKIQPDVFEAILDGVAEGCRQANCKLIGGETAEMPGFYPGGEYDLAGFCVGVVEKSQLFPKTETLVVGDVIIGLASSGLHSNGYSLVRKLLSDHQVDLFSSPAELGTRVIDAVLAPTTIYVKPVLNLLKENPTLVKAMVHNTGGGFLDNIPRVLPPHLAAVIETHRWTPNPIFGYLQQLGGLDQATLMHTFNMGIGFMVVVSEAAASRVLNVLTNAGGDLNPTVIGHLVDHQPSSSDHQQPSPTVILQ